MLCVAIFVICNDCIIHSFATKRRAMRSALMMRNGAHNIESSMPASTACESDGSSRFLSITRLSSTKPNSPACASPRPVRMAVPGGLPNRRARPAISVNLTSSGPTKNSSTNSGCFTTMTGSSSMPVVMKNRPSNTSRNGLMSSST